jgi:hypothetical protein
MPRRSSTATISGDSPNSTNEEADASATVEGREDKLWSSDLSCTLATSRENRGYQRARADEVSGRDLQHRRSAPAQGVGSGPVPRFRLEFVDDGSVIDVDADDFDDDGEWISLYRYVPEGADPMAPGTGKDVVASFERTSLAGPPRPVG